MPDLTPAQQQAAFLRALADHLDAHPDLGDVVTQPFRISPADWQVRLLDPDGLDHDPWPLIRWARSLGVEQLHARTIKGETWSPVKFNASMSGHAVEVWAPIEGLPRDLDDLAVIDLEYFAEHGTLPETGGTDG